MKLYSKYLAMHLKSHMQYKTSLFFSSMGQFLMAFSTFLGIHFLFDRFDSVGGFGYEEVLICFAIILVAYTLGEVIGRGFDRFPEMLGNGGFDRVLVRPRSVIFQVLSSQINTARTAILIQAVGMLIYAIPRSGIIWTYDNILVMCLMIICGTILFFSFFLLYGAVAFFTVEGLEFMNILTSGAREHGRLPYGIYGDGVLRFLTFVIPLALVQYYPLLYLTRREESILYAIMPIFATVFLLPCYLMFRFGMSKYKSTGS